MQPYYPAKLLLFGEYTVLRGSQALAIPLNQWHGKWEQLPIQNGLIEESLTQYIDWLQSTEIIDPSIANQIIQDANGGWKYHANIPIGFGLGSSGAYVAAIYDRYISGLANDVSSAHVILSKMESYFHGSSSGMDPLVSYSQKALYKSEKGDLHTISDPGWPEGYNIFLLDTGTPRSTGSLVKTYKGLLEEDDFKLKIERELTPMVEHGIHFYLSGTGSKLEECLHIISEFQRKYFAPFIPEATKKQWDELRKNSGAYIKFCGAGGGGYFLVITTPDFVGELPANFIHIQQGNKLSK